MRATLSVLFSAILLAPAVTFALSIVWNSNEPSLIDIGSDGANRSTVYLYDPAVNVKYGVSVSEVTADGTKIRVLSSGETLPAGSRVLFEFEPHDYTDISWFGTGGSYDTPYGDWVASAAAPPGAERCSAKNLYDAKVPLQGWPYKVDVFAALSVAPPSQSVTINGATCTNSGSNGNKLCTLSTPGAVSANFQFQPTRGEFYAGRIEYQYATNPCEYTDNPMTRHPTQDRRAVRSSGGDYQLNVPLQSVPFQLTVVAASDNTNSNNNDNNNNNNNNTTQNSEPSAPALGASGGAQCIVGQPHAITMRSTDPEGDAVRYAIDWDNNGTVDQFVPSSGYLASGISATASRTYVTAGQKTVRVFAQDSGGAISPSTIFSFMCTASTAAGFNSNFNANNNTNNNGLGNGSRTPTLDLRAVPSLVRSGDSTTVHWSATNVDSCTVSGTNGDAWSGLVSPISGVRSSAISGEVRFTLRCLADDSIYTRQVAVRVLPGYREK